MFKKLLASSSILFFALFLVSTSVFAATPTEDLTKNQQVALQIINKANAEIDAKIATAVSEANALQATYQAEIKELQLSETGTTLVTMMEERKAEYTKVLNEIITNLYNETLEISNVAIEKAAKLGVTAECTWVLVKLADQTVWIDPLVVGT